MRRSRVQKGSRRAAGSLRSDGAVAALRPHPRWQPFPRTLPSSRTNRPDRTSQSQRIRPRTPRHARLRACLPPHRARSREPKVPARRRLRGTSRRSAVATPTSSTGSTRTEPAKLEWTTAADGSRVANYNGRALASRHAPRAEARDFADTVNYAEKSTAVLLGFGLGTHVTAVCERMGMSGLVIVYEPDLALLRRCCPRST